jgi:hypothetical protein
MSDCPSLDPAVTMGEAMTLGTCMIRRLLVEPFWEIAMAKRLASSGAAWSATDLKTLKKLASNGTAAQAAKTMGRTAAAVQQKAMRTGISFRKSRRGTTKKK